MVTKCLHMFAVRLQEKQSNKETSLLFTNITVASTSHLSIALYTLSYESRDASTFRGIARGVGKVYFVL